MCVCVRVRSNPSSGRGGLYVRGVGGLIWLVYQLIKGQSKCQRENKRNFYAFCMRSNCREKAEAKRGGRGRRECRRERARVARAGSQVAKREWESERESRCSHTA